MLKIGCVANINAVMTWYGAADQIRRILTTEEKLVTNPTV